MSGDHHSRGYTELHCHSAFSFLDGASLPEELVAAALESGHQALALTDHNSISGSMEFAKAAQGLGLKAMHGAEVDVGANHMTLLVRDATGWANLCRLLTKAHAHTRDDDPARRAIAPSLTLEDVEAHAGGLVCLSGCADHGFHDYRSLLRLREIFGRDCLRVELQRPFSRHDRARNRRLEELAGRLQCRTVATGNVHAHARSRAELQDAFVAIAKHTSLDASEPLRRGNHSHVLTTPAAMSARFADHPAAVANTRTLAAELNFDLTSDLGYRYPGSDDDGADRALTQICRERFDVRYPHDSKWRTQALARLDEELNLIAKLGLSGFFNLHHDMLELAREVAVEIRGPDSARSLMPPGRGRGSSVSSIVCYLTGLSHIDPVANNLFLGRFLNEEISSLPDIDLDFPRDIRAELIPRVHRRYGNDHAALVAAFPTYRARGAIRELGKVLGLPAAEIERVARSSEGWSAHNVEGDIQTALKEKRIEGRWEWLVKLADEAHGLPRHLSQHSGGMIISTRPLVDCCAVVPAAMQGRQMVMWDKDSCSDAGFLKIDLLGLGMLSSVERCVESIAVHRNERIDLSRISFEDPATFSAIQNAETTGVFQIESRAQMGSLMRTRPANLDELTIQVAIVRPGPIVGGAVNPYIDRLQKKRADPAYEIPYLHLSLKEPLEETLGTIIFQDQVIEVAMAFAGFSPGQAEGLRRAMSRKRSVAAIEAHHDRFVTSAQAMHSDVTPELAESVWQMVKGFAGFGFPKAHGAAFGLLAYQSTYLRVHYGPEFLVSLLDEQPMGFYPPDALIHEAQRRGIEVLAPDVNESDVECSVISVDRPAIRMGLGYVMGVKETEVRALVAARKDGGRFESLPDLASRAGAGSAALAQLAWSGACDALAQGQRRRALWELGVTAPGRRVGEAGVQLSLPLDSGGAPDLPELGEWDRMLADYETTSMTTTKHPIALLRKSLQQRGCISSADLADIAHGSAVRIAGLVIARQRPGTARGVVFMLIEDETGTVNLIVPADLYERERVTVRSEPLVEFEGRLERHASGGGAINVLVKRLRQLDAESALRPYLGAPVADFDPGDAAELAREAAEGSGGDFRAVAPAAQSFASGRRR
ncbi:MAG TPA: DNA polymerase III subunit alpha [Baekduia sp.]|nr:DNA polymerase III subunit alpha [Baekduia sp.]